jgi:predicted RNase H-like HicB family nuclease
MTDMKNRPLHISSAL